MKKKDKKKEYLIQLKHIIDIDSMLHNLRKPTLKEISEKINLTERSISRYLKMMKDSFSAPIRCSKNDTRYEYDYSDPTYSFMNITISQNEANALIAARQLIQSIPLPGFYSKTIEGLNNLIVRAERFNKIEGLELYDKIVFATDCEKASYHNNFTFLENCLCEALQKNLPVRFAVKETTEDITPCEEVYYPLLLTSYHGTWYILAVKNALGSSEKMKYKLPAELSEKDFELINFYDIVDAKIIALAKDRELPEIIAKHENTFSYCPPVEITYDEKGYPVLTFGFWFMDYRVDLQYRYNWENGRIEQFKSLPFKSVYKDGEFFD